MSETRKPRARTVEPNRSQGVIRFEMPELMLPPSHRARVIDQVVGTLDLSGFTVESTSVDGHAGRSTLSPRMMLTLWLYAISESIGSARRIARLVKSDDAFRWIVGGVAVSHHSLSAFRVGHGARFNQLLTDILAVLMHKGLLLLDLVAQDGTRIRANASAPSFRRHESLLECREQAALHLKAVLADGDNPEHTAREHAARKAAAEAFQKRVEEAIETVVVLQQERDENAPQSRREKPARASTTDAEARVMKMPDGGFRPGYNVQLAVAGSELGGARAIVGVQVTNLGSDMGSVTPMIEQILERTGALPERILADANHAKHECIERGAELGVELLIAVPKNAGDATRSTSQPVLDWHARMETDEAKRLYRARAGLVELTNAHIKEHLGVDHLLVRGVAKVTCVALLAGLAFNILHNAAALLA
ncbi:MAG: IS1182 family transposase [Deltaproteobacteria bacterium]